MPMNVNPSSPPGSVPGGDDATQLVALLARSSRGDESAFADLYDRTSSKVYGLARRVVRDPAQAEEVAQEAYLEVWRQSARYDTSRGSVLAWMLTIVHRRAVDRVRSSEASRERDTKFATLGDGPDYDVVTEAIPVAVSPKNRLLLGLPRRQ